MARSPLQVLVLPYRREADGGFSFAVFQRSDTGYWQGIAGGGEDDEDALAAARREALEEAGIPETARFIELQTVNSIPVYHYPARKFWPDDIYVVTEHCFGVDANELTIAIGEEHLAFRWVDYNTALDLLYWRSNKTALWELYQRLLKNDL